MPLVFGAICPHPPVLIPSVGKANLEKLQQTQAAMDRLEQELYSAKPDTIIIISPHGALLKEAYTINHSPKLAAGFQDFGDLATKLEFKNDIGLAYQIRESIETEAPVSLTTESRLDYGASIPLFYLTRHLKDVGIIPIGYSMLTLTKHLQFGEKIREILNLTNKRVAMIASADLSHRLTKDAPAGYSKYGAEFDKLLVDLIRQKQTGRILKLDKKLIKEAGECGLKSILILLGAFSEINYRPEILSYEGPFGVGYLVANLVI